MIQENADFYEKPTACFGDLAEFERQICQIAEQVGIELSEFEIDHLAVRVNTAEKAQAWKVALLDTILPPKAMGELNNEGNIGYATLLKESEVNGRPIALIDLHQPLIFCNQQVSVIELPFPKGKIYPNEGWEHIEIVVPMLKGESVAQWTARLCKQWDLTENPQIKLKISEPFVEGERLPNPSIAISLTDKSLNNRCTLKLHPYAIREICKQS